MIATNNIIAHTGDSLVYLCTNSLSDGTQGTVSFTGTNWALYNSVGKCTADKSAGTMLSGKPVLTTAYRLPAGSAAIGKGAAYPAASQIFPAPVSLTNLQVGEQFAILPNANTVQPSFAPRASVTDLGAFPYP